MNGHAQSDLAASIGDGAPEHTSSPTALSSVFPSLGTSLTLAWLALSLAWCLPLFYFNRFTPWFVLLIATLPLGVSSLVRLARGGDRAAWVGIAWVAWGFVSALSSSAPWVSIRGATGRDYSVVILCALVGVWALGRRLSRPTVDRIGPAATVLMALGTLVGTFQLFANPTTGFLATFAGRASGLSTNPVFYGSLMAGIGGYAAARASETGRRRWLAAVCLAGYGVMISGSRVAVFAAVVVVGVTVLIGPGRRRLWVPPIFSGGLAAGYALSWLAGARDPVERLSVGDAGRSDVWRYGVDGWLERPLLGWGLGLFRDAVQGRFSASFVRDSTAGGDQPWADPHNLVIMLLVTTGAVGLGLATAFCASALRRADAPLAAMFIGIAISWMLQPTPIVVAPVAMLILGAANSARAEAQGVDRPMARSLPMYVGLLLGTYFAAVDVMLLSDINSLPSDGGVAAERLFVGDARVSVVVSQRYFEMAQQNPALLEPALAAAERATGLEPTRPARWVERSQIELTMDRDSAAQASIDRALRLEPENLDAWLTQAALARRGGDAERLAFARDRICALTAECNRSGDGPAP